MNENNLYILAQWLSHNAEYLQLEMKESYDKAKTLHPQQAVVYLWDSLLYKTMEYNTTYSYDEVADAFEDERIQIVVNKYYLKDYVYEH